MQTRPLEGAFGAEVTDLDLSRAVDERLADDLLFGKLAKGGRVLVGAEGEELVFEFPEPDSVEVEEEAVDEDGAEEARLDALEHRDDEQEAPDSSAERDRDRD